MTPPKLTLTPKLGGLALQVKVVPGASRDRIAGEYAGGIKLTVRQPPEAGAANQAVLRLLAHVLQIETSQIHLTRGQTNPRKEVVITGLTAAQIEQRLAAVEAG